MEKTLIKGTQQKNKTLKCILLAAAALVVLALILAVITYFTGTYYDKGYTVVNPLNGKTFGREDRYVPYTEKYGSLFAFMFDLDEAISNAYGYVFVAGIAVAIIYVILYLKMNQSEIAVTNMRIIGRSNFGKQVDLPLAQVSSMTKCNFSGIAVSTSSGKTQFWLIDNREDVYNTISKAMADAQATQKEAKPAAEVSSADDLKKFKELLDAGVISQEEFDAKKKQLLGL